MCSVKSLQVKTGTLKKKKIKGRIHQLYFWKVNGIFSVISLF